MTNTGPIYLSLDHGIDCNFLYYICDRNPARNGINRQENMVCDFVLTRASGRWETPQHFMYAVFLMPPGTQLRQYASHFLRQSEFYFVQFPLMLWKWGNVVASDIGSHHRYLLRLLSCPNKPLFFKCESALRWMHTCHHFGE